MDNTKQGSNTAGERFILLSRADVERSRVNGAVLAEGFGITERRLQQLAKDGSVPKSGRAIYPLWPAMQALAKHLRQTGALADDTDPDKLAPFLRKAHYQAETARLALMTERGELIPRIEVEQEQGRVFKLVVQALETLPDILERDAGATPAMCAKVQESIDKLRAEIHAALIAEPKPDADSPVRQSA